LLQKLEGSNNRNAQFKTIISVIINGKQTQFEGICKGKIIEELKGTDGFGYDPIFIPDGSNKTFAEMTMEEKNIYSHRRKATDKLMSFLLSS
jgi:XTP/dITP diphosphohydrolase